MPTDVRIHIVLLQQRLQVCLQLGVVPVATCGEDGVVAQHDDPLGVQGHGFVQHAADVAQLVRDARGLSIFGNTTKKEEEG